MKVLIIGNGGREHALAWKIAQSDQVTEIFVAPGNGGTELENKVKNIPIESSNVNQLLQFAKVNQIDLTIVGPEQPLVLGIVDLFLASNLACFGPTAKASQLEGSKAFTKSFLKTNQIPTAEYEIFTDYFSANEYCKQAQYPLVIKADGLACGKGVFIVNDFFEAQQFLLDIMQNKILGEAGSKIVIEEFLIGEELSFIVMINGENIVPLASSQDHKRRFNNDQGPNTGGMGAYSPAPILTPYLNDKIMNEIIYPTVRGLLKLNISYTGFLYVGLMIDKNNNPKVLEFNVRLGDPETQAILPRLKNDLFTLIQNLMQNKLQDQQLEWDNQTALSVVAVSKGYPEKIEKNKIIKGLNEKNALDKNIKIFHAGTKQEQKNFITSGGRVLCVTALESSALKANENALSVLRTIHWDDIDYRNDIGHRAFKKDKNVS